MSSGYGRGAVVAGPSNRQTFDPVADRIRSLDPRPVDTCRPCRPVRGSGAVRPVAESPSHPRGGTAPRPFVPSDPGCRRQGEDRLCRHVGDDRRDRPCRPECSTPSSVRLVSDPPSRGPLVPPFHVERPAVGAASRCPTRPQSRNQPVAGAGDTMRSEERSTGRNTHSAGYALGACRDHVHCHDRGALRVPQTSRLHAQAQQTLRRPPVL